MRILVIDNGSSYIDELLYLLEDNDLSVTSFSSDIRSAAKDKDVVILSGGHSFPIEGNESLFKKEMDFVVDPGVPVIGVCFGSELIARAFGAEIESLPRKEKGMVMIRMSENNIFPDIEEFPVFENHSFAVKKLPESLIEIASSSDGVEIFRHKLLPVWGLQFHPEMNNEKSGGDEFIIRLIDHLVKKENPAS